MNRIQWGRVEYITDPLVQAKNPAIGAVENGLPPMRFGREMAPESSRAPWELY